MILQEEGDLCGQYVGLFYGKKVAKNGKNKSLTTTVIT